MRILNNKKDIFFILLVICFFIILLNFKQCKTINYLMEETRYETPIYYLNNIFKKKKIFIISGIHGNEIGGIEASEKIIKENHKWGEMIIIPRANNEAYKLRVRNPYYMSDLNRVFPGKKNGTDTERLADEIFNIIKKVKPDIVFDLHEWDSRFDEDSSLYMNALIFNSIGGEFWKSAEKIYNEYNGFQKGDKLVLNVGPPAGSINKEVSERLNIPVVTIESNINNRLEDRVDFHLYIIKNIIKNWEME